MHVSQALDDSTSGTTAIVCYFHGTDLYVSNIGDSRAIIGARRGNKVVAFPLSHDQTPFRRDERERCKMAGAIVRTMDQL